MTKVKQFFPYIVVWVSILLYNIICYLFNIEYTGSINIFNAEVILFFIHPLIFYILYRYCDLPYRFKFYKVVLYVAIISISSPTMLSKVSPSHFSDYTKTRFLAPFTAKEYIIKKQDNNSVQFTSINDETELVYFNSLSVANDSVTVIAESSHTKYSLANFVTNEGYPVTGTRIFYCGTDQFGRDIFSGLIAGTRNSLIIALGAAIISVIIGIVLGFISSVGPDWIGISLNRISDAVLAFPAIILATMLIAFAGKSIVNITLLLGLTGWMPLYKILKSEVAEISKKDFYLGSESLNFNKIELLKLEILPVIIVPLSVNFTFQVINVVVAEAILSYLGLNPGENYISWGTILNIGQNYFLNAWWLVIFPSVIFTIFLYSLYDLSRDIKNHTMA